MKNWIVIIVLFFTTAAQSQVDIDQINFGQISYKVTGSTILQRDLEEILNAFASFSYKSVILEEVLTNLLSEKDNSYIDSTAQYWLNDFSDLQIDRLKELPLPSDHFIEEAFSIVMMSIFGKAYVENISFIESWLKISKDQRTSFPNMPDFTTFIDVLSFYRNYYTISKWYLEFPGEYSYFEEMIRNQTHQHLGNSSDESIAKFVQVVRADIIDKNSIYKNYLPLSIDTLNNYVDQLNYEIQYADLCNETDINDFLIKSYELIYDETPSVKMIDELKTYVLKNEVYDPHLIYLSLILARYE